MPEARFGIGHGQMDEDVLEEVILGFVRKEFDVLISTTIIESGIDIPNVNTIIIDNADTFGLTQLYQLRGRVGRSTNRAYAYLLFKPDKALSAEAQARLEAIQEATELGAGLRVAMRDMEIRGAGNILGAEQSGHIAAIGYDLYIRLLARRSRRSARASHGGRRPVIIDLPLTALIPADYIVDTELRLAIYRRVAAVEDERQLDGRAPGTGGPVRTDPGGGRASVGTDCAAHPVAGARHRVDDRAGAGDRHPPRAAPRVSSGDWNHVSGAP